MLAQLNKNLETLTQSITRRGFLGSLVGFLFYACNLSTSDEGSNTDGPGTGKVDNSPEQGQNDNTNDSEGEGGQEEENEDTPLEPTTCDESADNIEGPFYRENAPLRTDLRDGINGTRVDISGSVLDTGCQPIPNALIDVWQADNGGDYDNSSDAYVLRGRFYSNESGEYTFRTIHPGHYPNGGTYRPAHIHVKVSAEGYKDLTTQLYFAGDEYNDGDPFIVDTLIMDIVEDGENELCTFNFVLAADD